MPSALEFFSPPTRRWLARRFAAPTEVQARGWPLLAAGRHALLVAPTGSGKTLAAFLTAIDRLGRRPADASSGDARPGVRVLYVSPLKALVSDIERNLRAPLAEIAAEAAETAAGEAIAGREGEFECDSDASPGAFRAPRVAIRTGDSTPRERRQQARDPAEILVTTPESLYLILGSQAREMLATVETIIVDEIHALAPTKRGVHLALSLERVARRAQGGDPQRIGLSATARPTVEIARFLGGDRPVEIVDVSRPPALALEVRVPVPDMTRPLPPVVGNPDEAGPPTAPPVPSLWSAIHPELLAQIRAHRSTLVFTNSRALCERLAQAINDLAGEPLVRAHHGSVSHAERRAIEQALALGQLRGIVATSSLELGIDMAAVELVVLVESPGAVARGLQRVGRAGHAVGATSHGLLYPKHRADLLEAAAVALGMRAGEVEAIDVPRGALDVLAQQIVAIAAEGPTSVEAVAALIARTAAYAELDRRLLVAVLDMLSGKYPSTDFAELRPRLRFDRASGALEIRDGAAKIALLSGGTIPDRGQYAVHVAPTGPRIGELDEEMVHESKPGDVVVLGASSWRIAEIGRDRVLVLPAPGEPGRLPFWRGDGPGRPIELGRAIGRLVRTLESERDPAGWLRARGLFDENAITNLVAYLEAQRAATGAVGDDRTLVVERFRDELGDFRIAIHSPFGARVHAPWALAIAEHWRAQGGSDVHPLWTDDGILLRFTDLDRPPATERFFPSADDLEDLVCAGLEDSALFASQFRENAARALLLPRRHARARTPLWAQRLRARNLHEVARAHPDFPILLETHRSCLRDVFDLPSLAALLRAVTDGEVAVRDVETTVPSPFARSLVFAYTASFLYQPDMPVAERRSQVLALDRAMLRELLGETDWRGQLDVEAIDDVVRSRQRLEPDQRVESADGLHDRLRELGALSTAELARRFGDRHAGPSLAPASTLPPAADPTFEVLLDQLRQSRRAIEIQVAGDARWIAVEESALYRDALGVALPEDLDAAWLVPTAQPLEQLVTRHARTHGPFTTRSLAQHLGLREEALLPVLESLARRGRLLGGGFDPRAHEPEWLDDEGLRRIKRKTLARLREAIAPAPSEVVARFLLDWHGLTRPARGPERLLEAIDRMEGLPLSLAELERAILPLRVADYDPAMLDRLGSEGRVVWRGREPIGSTDARITICRRERFDLLVEKPQVEATDAVLAMPPLEAGLAEYLGRYGASFFADLVRAFPGDSPSMIGEAIWSLVWQGRITNDTFAPLRASRARPSRARPASRRRPGRHAPPDATSGRWSLLSFGSTPNAASAPRLPSPTERLHARALCLLERHGIVSRDAIESEDFPGGFAALYPVLRELEEAGRVRRGNFIAGATSAQFALPGAIERMRAARDDRAHGSRGAHEVDGADEAHGLRAAPRPDEADANGSEPAILLASLDPAQPYGALLPWPETRAGRPRRAVGTSVVLVGGRAALFVERGGRKLLVLERDAPRIGAALRALAKGVARLGLRRLSVERIDGESALRSPLAPQLLKAGFRTSERGFEIDRVPGLLGDRAPVR